MRIAIKQLLINGVPQVNGRVYEPQVAGAKTQKPYLVLREGAQAPEADWAAFSTVIEVWPYVARTTFQLVDTLATSIIDTLHRTRFTDAGEQYLIDYLGTTGQDFVDEDWDVITRGLRFQVFSLGWLNGLTYNPDPIVTLRNWTMSTWPEVHTDPGTWSPMDATPGIYWRLVRLTLVETTAAVNWVEAQINGHILVPSAVVRLVWIRKVIEGITKQRRLKMSDGGPLEMLKAVADNEADPMRRGQVQLSARFGVLQPAALVEILNRAVIGGDVTGEVN